VLASSPAAAAGIEPGDVILRYDDVPVFAPYELKEATSDGRAGSTVAVDVWRQGERERVYLPRGPLGVQLLPTRRPPSESP
jgi:S1-C subfamily serine protease